MNVRNTAGKEFNLNLYRMPIFPALHNYSQHDCHSQDLAISYSAWSTLIGRVLHSGALPAFLCHKEPARRIQSPLLGALERKIPPFACSSLVLYGIRDRWLPCTERSYYRRPYAIKNQRGASKIPPNGGILRSKAPSRGLWMPELVLYGIRELVEQFL